MPNLTDKYRYHVFPERLYLIRDKFGNTVTVTGQDIVERFTDGQKDKETERETSELNQA
jgi:hypothetical protein